MPNLALSPKTINPYHCLVPSFHFFLYNSFFPCLFFQCDETRNERERGERGAATLGLRPVTLADSFYPLLLLSSPLDGRKRKLARLFRVSLLRRFCKPSNLLRKTISFHFFRSCFYRKKQALSLSLSPRQSRSSAKAPTSSSSHRSFSLSLFLCDLLSLFLHPVLRASAGTMSMKVSSPDGVKVNNANESREDFERCRSLFLSTASSPLTFQNSPFPLCFYPLSLSRQPFQVYNVSSGKSTPQWLSESKKRALRKDEEYR